MRWIIRAAVAAVIALQGGVSAAAPSGTEAVAIIGADILPMAGPERLRNQTVIVRGDRIVDIGPRSRVRVPAGARRIDASGMTLMPGLVDLHVHLAPAPGEKGDAAARSLAVMLGYGTTTARSLAGAPIHPEVRAKLEKGELPGPRIYIGTAAMHGQNTPDEAAARKKVAEAKAQGFDLVKSHHLEKIEVWQALQDEAAKQKLPTAGHVTNQVGIGRAMQARQQIEHLDGMLVELLPKDSPARAIPFGQLPPPPVIQALSNVTDADFRRLAQQVKAAGSYQVPTMALFERVFDLATPTERFAAEPAMRFIPKETLQQWAKQREGLSKMGLTPEVAARLLDIRRRLFRAFYEAGVPMMPGSDTPQGYHVWGEGLIKEIESFVAAGMKPIDALRSATVVPRNYFRSLPNGGSTLGWKADFGTVEKGGRADLILLAGDPTKRIAELRNLKGVMAAGVWRDRAALDSLHDEAAAAANPPGK